MARLRIRVESGIHRRAPGELERIADIVSGGDPADTRGCDGILISKKIKAGAEFLEKQTPPLTFVARPGIAEKRILHQAERP